MIDLTKTYRTREGSPARFLTKIQNPDYPLIFAIKGSDGIETINTYTETGRYYCEDEHGLEDLVEYNPWKDLPIDTPIYVADEPQKEWIPRYFAGLDQYGKIKAFNNGTTSFTNESINSKGYATWKFAKLKDE